MKQLRAICAALMVIGGGLFIIGGGSLPVAQFSIGLLVVAGAGMMACREW